MSEYSYMRPHVNTILYAIDIFAKQVTLLRYLVASAPAIVLLYRELQDTYHPKKHSVTHVCALSGLVLDTNNQAELRLFSANHRCQTS